MTTGPGAGIPIMLGGRGWLKPLSLASDVKGVRCKKSHGGLAQLGERLAGSQKVSGSSPLSSTRISVVVAPTHAGATGVSTIHNKPPPFGGGFFMSPGCSGFLSSRPKVARHVRRFRTNGNQQQRQNAASDSRASLADDVPSVLATGAVGGHGLCLPGSEHRARRLGYIFSRVHRNLHVGRRDW